MADETLGNLSVEITGDYSGLITAINQASTAAQQGSQQIVDAVNQTGASATQAVDKFQEFAQALAGIGEALAVTEGLKEFGEEALTAAGTVQSVEIALTQLSGSADEAAAAISNIKDLAATEPFAFPDIAPAVQKMVALGVSMDQLPSAMQAVADAAAATGNQFNNVAQSFDRISSSGTLSARALVQLGLNTHDLATAMGVADEEVKTAFKDLDQTQRIDVLSQALEKFAGSAEAQAQGIAGQWQIFKNQFEEVMVAVGDALTPAISDILNFGESVLHGIQEAIDAFNSLPGPVKEAAGALAILAGSVAPLLAAVSAVGIGLIGLRSAVEPLNGLLGALGVASTEAAAGETALATASEAATVAVGGTSEVVAAAGTAAVAAETGVGSLAAAFGGIAAVAAGPVVASLIALKSNLDDLKAHWDQVTQEIIQHSLADAINAGNTVKDLQQVGYTLDQIKTAFGNFGVAGATVAQQLAQSMDAPIKALTDLNIPIEKVQESLAHIKVDGIPVFALLANSPDFATFSEKVTALGGNIDQINAKLNSLAPNFATVAKSLTDGFSISLKSATDYTKAIEAISTQQESANAKVTEAKAVLDHYKDSLDGTQASQILYNDALKAYDAAVLAANPHSKDFADSIAGLKQKVADAQSAFNTAEASLKAISQAFADGKASVALYDAALQAVSTTAKAAGVSVSAVSEEIVKANQAFTNSQQAYADAVAVLKAFTDQLAAGASVSSQFGTALDNLAKTSKTAGDSFSDANDKTAALDAVVSELLATYQSGNDKVLPDLVKAYNAWIQSLQDGQKAQTNADASMQTLLNTYVDALKKMGDSTLDITAKVQAWADKFQQAVVSINQGGQTIYKVMTDVASATSQIGDAADATSVQVIKLTDSESNYVSATNDAMAAADALIQKYEGEAVAAADAADKVNSLAQAEESAGSWASQDFASNSGAGKPGSAESILSLYASQGAPMGVLDQIAEALGLVPVGNKQYITKQEYAAITGWVVGPDGNLHPPAKGQNTDQFGRPLPAASSSSSAPTAGGPTSSSASSGGMVALVSAASSAADQVTAMGQAAAATAQPLGAYVTAVAGAATSASTTIPIMAALSVKASDLYSSTTALTGQQTSYYDATANAINAQNAYADAINSGQNEGTIANLYQAMVAADQAMQSFTGTVQVAGDTSPKITEAFATTVTAQNLYNGDLTKLTAGQQANITAQAALVNAQNALANAINSGQPQSTIDGLYEAAQDATVALRGLTGGVSVSGSTNPATPTDQAMAQNGFSTTPTTPRPTAAPAGGDPSGAWEWDGFKWTWTAGMHATGGVVGGSPGTIGFGTPFAPPSTTSPWNTNSQWQGSGSLTSPGVTVNLQVNAGTVVGNNGMNQLADAVQKSVIGQLRQAGLKV